MATRQVTSTGKDTDGDITKLCGSFGSVSKLDAIAEIKAETNIYKSGNSTIEVVLDASVAGGKYLRTRPDGSSGNNLDELPDC